MEVLIVSCFSLLGVIIGATLQFFYSKRIDNKNLKSELENEVYSDYVKAVVGLTFAQKTNNAIEKEKNLIALTESKAKILIYGNKKVIQYLSEFEKNGAQFLTKEQRLIFIEAIQSMRNGKSEDIQKEISQLLFSE